MRVVLMVTGTIAALLALGAIVLGVSERVSRASVAVASQPAAADPPRGDCSPDECGPAPRLHCPAGVAPTCTRTNGACRWDLPATCTTEPPCPNGGSPPLCNVSDEARPPIVRRRNALPAHVPDDFPSAPAHDGNLLEQASALSLAGDNAGARALLEPHVFGGRGTSDEVRALRGICKAQHDTECVAAIAKRYP